MTETTSDGHGRPIVAVQLLLRGTVAYFALAFFASLVFAGWLSIGHDVVTLLLLMLVPTVHLAVAAILTLLHDALAPRRRWLAGGVVLVLWLGLLVFRFGPGGYLEPWASRTLLPLRILPLVVVLGLAAGVHALSRFVPAAARLGAWGRRGLLALLAVVALGFLPPQHTMTANRFGLVSFPPHDNVTADFPKIRGKGGYPVCTFEHNSLGFRDVEPSPEKNGRQRVLAIGDSFMWGDGIASNAETLPYRLRADLEAAAPGRYEVVAAAYPGIGVYAYHRFVTALQPELRPDIVVIGFLGGPDLQAFDSQKRLESLPTNEFLHWLLVNLGVPQQIHAASVIHAIRVFSVDRGPEEGTETMQQLRRHAAEHGYRLIILDYDCIPPHPSFHVAGLEVLRIPEGWKMRSRDSEYWYLEEEHPRARLNEELAKLVAERILAGPPQE